MYIPFYTIMPPLVLLSASLPHSLTIQDIVSFLVPHIIQRGDTLDLSISHLI